MGEQSNKKNEHPFFPWGFHILDKWIQIKNKGKSLSIYFEDNLMHRVAIYGLGAIGKSLYEELCQTKIKVCYGIDKNAANIRIDGLEMKTLEEELTEVDVVVVTPIAFYEIEKNIYQKMGSNINIVAIEDVVNYCINLAQQISVR